MSTENENIRKWLPIFQNIDVDNILTDTDKINLYNFSESMAYSTQSKDISILSPFLKAFYKIKQKYNSPFLYGEKILAYESIEIGNLPYNILLLDKSENRISDKILESLDDLYKNNDVFIYTISSISDSTPMSREYKILLHCTLIEKNNEFKEDIDTKEETKNFQQCSHLKIEDVFSASKNTLSDLYNLQKDIQKNVYGYDFEAMQSGPLNELRSFFDWNYHAMHDEMMEALNALGGMSDGIGNGVWKPWKKSYTEQAPNMSLNDMSERDKKELKMELIDIQHFLFNLMLSVGMTEKELMNFYYAKNSENRSRQERGY